MQGRQQGLAVSRTVRGLEMVRSPATPVSSLQPASRAWSRAGQLTVHDGYARWRVEAEYSRVQMRIESPSGKLELDAYTARIRNDDTGEFTASGIHLEEHGFFCSFGARRSVTGSILLGHPATPQFTAQHNI